RREAVAIDERPADSFDGLRERLAMFLVTGKATHDQGPLRAGGPERIGRRSYTLFNLRGRGGARRLSIVRRSPGQGGAQAYGCADNKSLHGLTSMISSMIRSRYNR